MLILGSATCPRLLIQYEWECDYSEGREVQELEKFRNNSTDWI